MCNIIYINWSVIDFCSHEGEMYKSLLSDYEASQKSLMLENAELKKVLQQMKKEMIHILSPRSSSGRGATADDSQEQVFETHTHTSGRWVWKDWWFSYGEETIQMVNHELHMYINVSGEKISDDILDWKFGTGYNIYPCKVSQ